tara:strand:+ start:736 stop:1293 length:558 start_codon:yes stop_codon:yes gene_type:complete
MFTIIQSSSTLESQFLLSKALETRQKSHGYIKDSFDTSTTLYIIYENPQFGATGSARLNLLKDSPASFYYRNRFSKEDFNDILELSLVSFHMKNNCRSKKQPEAFDYVIQDFYRGLYSVLTDIMIDQNLEGIVSLSHEENHPDLTFFGGWSFSKTQRLKINGNYLLIGEIPMGIFHDHETGKIWA